MDACQVCCLLKASVTNSQDFRYCPPQRTGPFAHWRNLYVGWCMIYSSKCELPTLWCVRAILLGLPNQFCGSRKANNVKRMCPWVLSSIFVGADGFCLGADRLARRVMASFATQAPPSAAACMLRPLGQLQSTVGNRIPA